VIRRNRRGVTGREAGCCAACRFNSSNSFPLSAVECSASANIAELDANRGSDELANGNGDVGSQTNEHYSFRASGRHVLRTRDLSQKMPGMVGEVADFLTAPGLLVILLGSITSNGCNPADSRDDRRSTPRCPSSSTRTLYHCSRGKPYVELSQATIFRKVLRLDRIVRVSNGAHAFSANGFYRG